MVNFTRKNLLTRIQIDFGQEAKIQSDNYVVMAEVSFFNLLGIQKDNADPKLVEDVKFICGQFAKVVRRKWRTREISRHYDRLLNDNGPFFSEYFHVPFLDKKATVPEPNPETQEPDEVGEPSSSTTGHKPAKARKSKAQEDLPFEEKVIVLLFCIY